jgi:hypothetical protein
MAVREQNFSHHLQMYVVHQIMTSALLQDEQLLAFLSRLLN